MSNLQRKYKQVPDISIYEPECAVHSPELLQDWADSLQVTSEFNEQFVVGILTLIPDYCCQEDRKLPGPPEFWQRNILSYSFYFGLGLTIFDRHLARTLLYGLVEGPSRYLLFWLNEVNAHNHPDLFSLWTHAINLLTVFTSRASPETTGPDTNEELVKQRASISGFTPAIRLGLTDPEFARALFQGALDEKEKCGDEELAERIKWIKATILDSFIKNHARSSN